MVRGLIRGLDDGNNRVKFRQLIFLRFLFQEYAGTWGLNFDGYFVCLDLQQSVPFFECCRQRS